MIAQPTGTNAEAFRMLRTNLDFATLESSGARTILVTSAVEQEGKSTTSANLAIAEARAGRRVVLVDLDLRVAYLDRFFGLLHAEGITDVALGNVTLESALKRIDLDTGAVALGTRDSTESNGRRPSTAPSTCSSRGRCLPTRASSWAAGGWARSSRACTRTTTWSSWTRPPPCASATR